VRPTSRPLDDVLEQHRDEYVELWRRLVSEPSVTGDTAALRRCAGVVYGIMADAGLSVRLLETASVPAVYGELKPDPTQVSKTRPLSILFYGHYDVQTPGPMDAWVSPPFAATIRAGRLYGRGASDNKGQFLSHILALRVVLEAGAGAPPPVTVKFLIEGDEEAGSPSLESVLQHERERLAADVVVISGGPKHASGAPILCFGVRGFLQVEFIARGAAWDNHSGISGGALVNPAWALVSLLARLRGDRGELRIPGFHDKVRIEAQDDVLLRELPFDGSAVAAVLGLPQDALADEHGVDFYRRTLLEPTFEICALTSGTGSGAAVNPVIPSEARAIADIRLVADQDPDDIFHRLRETVAAVGTGVEVVRRGSRRPFRTSPDHPMARLVTDAATRAFGRRPLLYPSMGGSLPNAVFGEILEAPVIGLPYANPDHANHAPNENMTIAAFLDGIRCSAHIIAALAEERGGTMAQII
jgi:acetylornithine deacetylase/succinyl-diaminopimelate desuccinylase-like protein